jgi:hypothetical protein
MLKPFVYDEKTSSLFAPNGEFLKKVFCPKAVNWNQLIINEPEDKSRACNRCKSRIINLDKLEIEESLKILLQEPETCVSASTQSKNVIFLKDNHNPSLRRLPKYSWRDDAPISQDLPIISTVRNYDDIQRAVQMGFWPDIWSIKYQERKITTKFCVYQNVNTGEIKYFTDYRMSSDEVGDEWEEVIPWTNYYEHYQKVPIAAYLIPRDLPNNSEVLILDPIEDFVGASWNQGDTYRATNIKAVVVYKKVVLKPDSIERSDFVG